MMLHIIPSLIRIFFMIMAQLDSSPIESIRSIGLIASISCHIIDAYQYQFCKIVHRLFGRKK